MKEILQKIIADQSLSPAEIRRAFKAILREDTRDAEIGLFLSSLAARDLNAELLVGASEVLRERALPVDLQGLDAIDTCGTGGDRSGSFNFSTAAALVAAACGVPVAKHGNRSISSRCGSADLLEALGIPIHLNPGEVLSSLREYNFAFMLAPDYHPATKRVQKIRREIGGVTIFNFLGPLLNPAGVKRQVVGVFDPKKRRVMAEAFQKLGAEKIWVVSGENGLDEMNLSGRTFVTEVGSQDLQEKIITPEEAGLPSFEIEDLRGGDATENAQRLVRIFSGEEQGAIEMGIVFNAAAALVVAEKVSDLRAGVEMAREAVGSGRALRVLRELQKDKN